MVRLVTGEESLRHLFAGLIEDIFHVELGVPSPSVVDYLTELLMRFARIEQNYKWRSLEGERLKEITDLLQQATVCEEDFPKREMHRHIGDFTLFWSSVYPEALKVLKAPDRKDSLINYRQQGQASYHIASSFREERFQEEAPILEQLSEEFDLFSYGLNCVRKEWDLMAAG